MYERVVFKMNQLGLNPNQLATRMGKRQSTIQSFLDRKGTSFRDLAALAKALETTIDWLSTGAESRPKVGQKIASQGAKISSACLNALVEVKFDRKLSKESEQMLMEKAIKYFWDDFAEDSEPTTTAQIKKYMLSLIE